MSPQKLLKLLVLGVIGLAGLNGCGEIGDDGISSVEQGVHPPPATVTATATSDTRITVSWSAVGGAIKYYVYQSVGPSGPFSFKGTARAPATTLAVANLIPATEYCYVVQTDGGDGLGGFSSPPACATTFAPPTPPPPPTTVTATPIATDRITVDWSSVASATRYFVYQSIGLAGPYNFINTVLAPGTSLSVANLTPNTLYCFKVASSNANGTSALSTATGCASTFTGALEGYWKLNEQTGTSAIDSSGQGRTGTLTGAVSYELTDKPPVADDRSAMVAPGGAGDFVTIPSAPALNLGGDFAVAMWIKIQSAPTGPVFFFGKRAAGCGASTWQLVQDSTDQLHFDGATVQARWNQTIPVGIWTHVAISKSGGDGNQSRLYLNGVQVTTSPYNAGAGSAAPVQIGNSGGCGNGAPIIVDEVRLYTTGITAQEISDLGQVPPAPLNLVATANASYNTDLTWSSVTGAQKYFVWKGTSSGNESFAATVFAPTTTYTDNHLTPSTQYFWQVRVQAHGLLSSFSNEATATTQPLPSPPTGVTANAISQSRIDVAWNAVSGAYKYYVYETIGAGTRNFKATVFAPTVTYSAINLTPNTAYTYELRVETSNGISDFSAPASATTPP